MACEFQVCATVILWKLVLEPLADVHNLKKSLEDVRTALQHSVEAYEVTLTENLQLKTEVARLNEALGNMEGRTIATEEAKNMRVTELKEVLERKARAKTNMDAFVESFQTDYENKIIHEHESGFKNVVRQAQYFCSVSLDFTFEVNKDFYKGVYMEYDEMPKDAEPNEMAPSRSAAPKDLRTTIQDDEDSQDGDEGDHTMADD
ncbi:uncharacterized protein LOC109791397 [Cajanus cajan]|uniref:uncharacterized protein LOC109791397 n=1 Tax=Cajanus cajan TaxID=3821 RepID=UPI00098DB4B5|nr:uncharacterized protein LOC109791397 [Cajanus cajan]XP_020206279.1 uncharacterized protein LOC109791397 [Cajanus cajan]XP_029125687.1 uncharacterized protein LOC109791397 [Cajanus cajan]XP_029125688.1 uncharacterized protein LOC109791397 [Cajanus cajan]